MQSVNISITEVREVAKKMHLERVVIHILKLKSLDTILTENIIKRHLIL